MNYIRIINIRTKQMEVKLVKAKIIQWKFTFASFCSLCLGRDWSPKFETALNVIIGIDQNIYE